MNFTLEGAAGGAQALGSGLGNIFKAVAMGPMVKQQAEDARALTLAKIYDANMSGNKAGAEAELKKNQLNFQNNNLDNILMENGIATNKAPDIQEYMKTGRFAPRYDVSQGPALPAPATQEQLANIGKAMALFNRTIGTGSKVDEMAKAGSEIQTQGIRDRALNTPNIEDFNRLMSVAGNKVYTPFNNVEKTGVSINQATGAQVETNPVLAKIFSLTENALANQRNASAGASNAQAKKTGVETGIEQIKYNTLRDTGYLPGTRGSGASGDFSKIRDDIRADYNAEFPVDSMTRKRGKNAPDFDTYTKNWLAKYNIPEADYFSSGAQRGAGKLTHDGYPARQNADGSYSTEVSITVTDPRLNGGKPTNIPSLWQGREVDQETAVKNAIASGKQYPSFATIPAAVDAAKARSQAGGAGANKNPSTTPAGGTMNNKPPFIGSVQGAPSGATIGAFVQGKGWQVKDKSGKVIGYAQE